MRLYLSSYRLADSFDELVAMAGRGARTGVISNALDFIPDVDREGYARNVYDVMADLRERGLRPFDLDLRTYFGDEDALAGELARTRLVWCVGGNAFLLRRAMRQSGFDRIAPPLIAADALVYGGWSAGAVVAGPQLRGLELMDDPEELAEGYGPTPIWEGLNLIDVTIVPHFQSEHPEADAADRAVAFLSAQGVPYRTLRDGEALVMNGAGLDLRRARA